MSACGGSCSSGSCGSSCASGGCGTVKGDEGFYDVNDAYQDAENYYLAGEAEEPCCDGCADGKGCASGCDGNCKGCDGACGNKKPQPEEGNFAPGYLPRVRRYQNALQYDAIPMQSSEQDGENYQLIMGTDLGDKIMEHAKVARVDENILVSIKNPRGEDAMVIRLPFVPVMNFVQSLAMMHGCPKTRPNTVMGYAPIIALLASQIAAKKVSEEGGNKTAPSASPMPFDLSSLFKMIPGLSMMAGVFYENDVGYSSVANILRRKAQPSTMGGGCGCGVPCDGIQPNSPYMSPSRVAQRNRVYRATAIRRGANYWDSAPLVNDQASNAFGRRDINKLIPNVTRVSDIGKTHQTSHRRTSYQE